VKKNIVFFIIFLIPAIVYAARIDVGGGSSTGGGSTTVDTLTIGTNPAAQLQIAAGTAPAGKMLISNGASGLLWANTGAGGGLANIVEDTTPQLGGDLDGQAYDITTTGIVTGGTGTFTNLTAGGQAVVTVTTAHVGDVTGPITGLTVVDDSHAHTGTTLSGIDISADTNLTAGDDITLTDDDLDVDATITRDTEWNTIDFLTGTATGSLSGEIVAGTAPGGELGGTWASPTIDDSVSVTSWNLTTPTITTSLTTSTPTTLSAAELDRLDGLTSAIIQNDAMDASSELLAIMDDETGTGFLVFNASPAFTTKITTPIIAGSTDASGKLTLQSTSNGTKSLIIMGTSAYDELNNRLGIGITAPTVALDVVGSIIASTTVTAANLFVSGNVGIGTTAPAAAFEMISGNTNTSYILQTKVGIGESSPAALLTVLSANTGATQSLYIKDGAFCMKTGTSAACMTLIISGGTATEAWVVITPP
jgi:hypothetical protein